MSEFEISHLWDINPNIGTTILFDTQDSVSYEFTIPDVYSLTYSVNIDGDQCNYDTSIEFNIGVIADIIAPSTICLGKDFIVSSEVDGWSSDHTYLWSSESELIIGTESVSYTHLTLPTNREV